MKENGIKRQGFKNSYKFLKDLITNINIMRKEMEDIKENKMKILTLKNIYLK